VLFSLLSTILSHELVLFNTGINLLKFQWIKVVVNSFLCMHTCFIIFTFVMCTKGSVSCIFPIRSCLNGNGSVLYRHKLIIF
jgi:hypothetical protein